MTQHQPTPKYIEAVYDRPRLKMALSVISTVSVLTAAAVFVFIAVKLLASDMTVGVCYLVFAAVPFLIVTLIRALVDAPRPYEVYGMPESFSANGRRAGHSFPSRHLFSAFAIGTLTLMYSLPLGITVLVFGCALGACRVLLGIHFLKDVIAGAVTGIFSGALGIIIVNFCL